MADRPGQRAGALILAAVFFFSTVALTGYVIWQVKQGNKDKQVQDAAQAALDQQKTQQNNTSTQEDKKLEGTKLANFTPVEKIDKLSWTDTVVGTGEEVKPGDTVTAHYTGAVAATGTIFQSSHDGANQPIPFSLNGVIKGWTDGVPGMKIGGTRRLLIPADQAYGANPPSGSNIPANADLVFDIELTAVEHK
jgi:FKBP-type peptidyl-prolyl cis-trans isomerase